MSALSDPARLRALVRSELMDSAPEEVFDRLTTLASRVMDAPIALMSLVDDERQFFKSAVGVDIKQTPLSHSLCQHVVIDQEPLVVSDARLEPRLRDNPAIDELGVIAYAGVPLTDSAGQTLGSFCVVQGTPREWESEEVDLLRNLARSAIAEIELRTMRRSLDAVDSSRVVIVQTASDAFAEVGDDGVITQWNHAAERLLGWPTPEAVGRRVIDTFLLSSAQHDPAADMLSWDPRTGLPVADGAPLVVSAVDRAGHGVLLELQISEVPLPAGSVFNVLLRQATERVHADTARQQSDLRLRAMIDHAPIGVALIELAEPHDGRILRVNDAFCAVVGRTPDPPQSLMSIIAPDDLEALRHGLEQLAAGAVSRLELELRCVNADGELVWLQLTGSAAAREGQSPGRAVLHAVDIGDRKRVEGQLQHLADHDPLTGLYNRRRFEEELTRAIARAERYTQRGAVLLIDLDGFKLINDTLGHSSGDELVTHVGSLMSNVMRETDVVARLGGDEFALIVSEADEAEAMVVAAKLLTALDERPIALADSRLARVTGSVGVTLFDGETGMAAGELLAEADIAMYEAKDSGKNTAMIFHRDGLPRSRSEGSGSWLTRLEQAIQVKSFVLFAQPVRGFTTPGIERFELLLRLRNPDGGLTAPGTFLYIAERYDLIQQIDRWVFGEAVEILRCANAAGNDISLSVNMSGKTLNDPNLLGDISALIERTPVKPDRLIVEVTETAAIVNIDRARQVARGLRELGCRFALDDFGSGFASFYYLKHLEFDYLKIDGEFVSTLVDNTTDQLVIQSVVHIAEGLGALTIAEFVGDEPTVACLRHLGVDFGQGYYLGKPGPLLDTLPAHRDRVPG
jgi:diguanylate cyclase (GGDEF)-like protein/PAS domain S-box-containing protein